MTSIAATERTELCALAEQLGPGAPTLCGGWTVRDLVVHLLVRERSLAALGLLVPRLARLTDKGAAKRAEREFPELVAQLRQGPPALSPFALPGLGAWANLLEFFVHHEDVRRAQPGWSARSLTNSTEDALWRSVRLAGRGLVARSPVGVVVARPDRPEQRRLKRGASSVTVRGLPSEVALYVYGRKQQARVDLVGEPQEVTALTNAPLGV